MGSTWRIYYKICPCLTVCASPFILKELGVLCFINHVHQTLVLDLGMQVSHHISISGILYKVLML